MAITIVWCMSSIQGNDSGVSSLSLDAKTDIAKVVVKDSLNKFKKPAIVWSAGKDSTTVLHIVKLVTEEMDEQLPPCIFIDHGDHFSETMELLNKLKDEWKLKLVIAKNQDVLTNIDESGMIRVGNLSDKNQTEAKNIGYEEEVFPYSLDNVLGNHLLKTMPMNEVIAKYRFDALFTGIRWDENPARKGERFVKGRDKPPHARVQPILPFTERNIWDYIFKFKIPYHALYAKGYRSIDGKMDSSKTSDTPAWEQDVEHTKERAGRAQEKEEMMAKLRQLGYM